MSIDIEEFLQIDGDIEIYRKNKEFFNDLEYGWYYGVK